MIGAPPTGISGQHAACPHQGSDGPQDPPGSPPCSGDHLTPQKHGYARNHPGRGPGSPVPAEELCSVCRRPGSQAGGGASPGAPKAGSSGQPASCTPSLPAHLRANPIKRWTSQAVCPVPSLQPDHKVLSVGAPHLPPESQDSWKEGGRPHPQPPGRLCSWITGCEGPRAHPGLTCTRVSPLGCSLLAGESPRQAHVGSPPPAISVNVCSRNRCLRMGSRQRSLQGGSSPQALRGRHTHQVHRLHQEGLKLPLLLSPSARLPGTHSPRM